MSQRDSGYERKERDCYETPTWVTEALVGYIDTKKFVWEPACGSGKMVNALRDKGFEVVGSDIETGDDFLKAAALHHSQVQAIVTNPPYVHATEFVEKALRLTQPVSGMVAMLLRTDFDHAKSRKHLFGGCKAFWCKLVLTRRIKWFEDSKGQPSFNHAWFIWDWQNFAYGNEPIIQYD